MIKYFLGFLLAFAAINAFGGGYYGMAGAEGVPVEWLDGTPFKSYFIPSLILFIVVGGSFLFASIAVFSGSKLARRASFVSVIVVFSWLAVQLLLIGYVSWMQPVTAITAVIILTLTMLMPQKPLRKVSSHTSND